MAPRTALFGFRTRVLMRYLRLDQRRRELPSSPGRSPRLPPCWRSPESRGSSRAPLINLPHRCGSRAQSSFRRRGRRPRLRPAAARVEEVGAPQSSRWASPASPAQRAAKNPTSSWPSEGRRSMMARFAGRSMIGVTAGWLSYETYVSLRDMRNYPSSASTPRRRRRARASRRRRRGSGGAAAAAAAAAAACSAGARRGSRRGHAPASSDGAGRRRRSRAA